MMAWDASVAAFAAATGSSPTVTAGILDRKGSSAARNKLVVSRHHAQTRRGTMQGRDVGQMHTQALCGGRNTLMQGYEIRGCDMAIHASKPVLMDRVCAEPVANTPIFIKWSSIWSHIT